MQATVVIMSECVVNRYLRHATDDMLRNNRKEIRCPCRKCKREGLLNPFTGDLLTHLLRRGFMDGHTQWISDDEDYEVHGAAAGNDQEGQQFNNNEGQEDEEPDPAHDAGEDGEHDVTEDEDARTPLTSVVQDPHLKELLLKKTTDYRSAARE